MTDLALHVPPGADQRLSVPPGTRRAQRIIQPGYDPVLLQIAGALGRAGDIPQAIPIARTILQDDLTGRTRHWNCPCGRPTADLLAGRPVLTPEQQAAKEEAEALPSDVVEIMQTAGVIPKPKPNRRERRRSKR